MTVDRQIGDLASVITGLEAGPCVLAGAASWPSWMRNVAPDELHEDAPVTAAAIREMRAAATPLPDVPVTVLSAASAFPLPGPTPWPTRSSRWRLRYGLDTC